MDLAFLPPCVTQLNGSSMVCARRYSACRSRHENWQKRGIPGTLIFLAFSCALDLPGKAKKATSGRIQMKTVALFIMVKKLYWIEVCISDKSYCWSGKVAFFAWWEFPVLSTNEVCGLKLIFLNVNSHKNPVLLQGRDINVHTGCSKIRSSWEAEIFNSTLFFPTVYVQPVLWS